MKEKRRKFALDDSAVLRRFSLLFFLMSVLPIVLLGYAYYQIKMIGVIEDAYMVVIPLCAIGVCIGYWGMRIVLRDLVNVVKVHTEALEDILGVDKVRELTKGKNEIAVLARTFDEVVFKLEDNVRKLELTKKTLQSVLNRVGDGLNSFDNIDSFLNLILETSTDALAAREGALLLYDDVKKDYYLKTAFGAHTEHYPKFRTKIDRGKIFEVIDRKKPIFINELKNDEHPNRGHAAIFHAPFLCAPLTFGDNVLGIMVINVYKDAKINDDDLTLLSNISLQTAVAIENTKLNEDAEKIYFETISALALAVEAKDPYSRGHLDRVADLVVKMAEHMKLSATEISTLRDAAKLHDVGKIGVLDEVLRKPGKLDYDEMEMMKKHAEVGEGIIAPIRSLRNLTDIVRHHHELLDGSGYPDGLKGEEISKLTQVLTVADIYDALTTTRPYRKALTKEKAVSIMKEEFEGKLDQKLVDVLTAVLD